MRYIFLLSFFAFCSLCWGEPTISKNQILYLVQGGEVERGIRLYQDYVKENGGRHDFQTLEQIGYILIRQGARGPDEECQLLSMYGLGIAGSSEGMELYEMGMNSRNPLVQLSTIQFLSHIQDDRVEPLLLKAFSSSHLAIRMEAAYVLATRRSDQVTGVIHSLMQRLPPYFHVYFPELFGMIGTSDAIGILKQMINAPHLNVRLAAILAAAKFERDDFLHGIRAAATHLDEAEQETCAAALGYLKDSHSIPLLKSLLTSPSSNVRLAASQSLAMLGDHSFHELIIEHALHKNLLAIPMLIPIPNTESLLLSLLQEDDLQIQINSALVLLKKRDARCVPALLQVLVKNEQDLGVRPMHSLGGAFMTWKIIPSCTQYARQTQEDLPSITLALREQILLDSLELPEGVFLDIARKIFLHKQNDLIPLLVRLLENLNTPEAIALLQEGSLRAGAPFIRTYCHLALFRMSGNSPHKDKLYKWIESRKDYELIRFRTTLPWIERKGITTHSTFQLSPEETSRLLVEAFETLAESHDLHGIDILLNSIRSGNPKNRYALAGLLLKAIQ